MSDVWDTLINIQDHFISKFDQSGSEVFESGMEKFNQPGWINRVWTSDHYRRAHVDVVDARDTKGLWMMHCCIFPHFNNPSPIFGFDVIAGKNKITGCFHDFSPAGDNEHPLIDWFAGETNKLTWNKIRKLPEWAERIFTSCMVAAGNVSDPDELEQITKMVVKNLNQYIASLPESAGMHSNTRSHQNFYCENQKQNPHTPKVMVSLGLSEEDVTCFIQECLFPEVR